MKYESKAENNVEKTVINEFIPNAVNNPLSGALGRGQKKFGTSVEGDVYNVQKSAIAIFNNLKELLANDPNAEAKKLKIIKLVYNWAKSQPLVPQQAAQPQNGQQQIPGTF
jgi:hypothetical protein